MTPALDCHGPPRQLMNHKPRMANRRHASTKLPLKNASPPAFLSSSLFPQIFQLVATRPLFNHGEEELVDISQPAFNLV